VTLSKSLGSQGGAVLGAPDVVEHLVNAARSFIFDTGLAPAAVGGALAALGVLRTEPGLADQVRARACGLADGLVAAGVPATRPDGAVVSVPVGDPGRAAAAAAALLDQGIRVGCFRPPSVPDGNSRLRLTARADLAEPDAARAVEAVARAL
jgi:8-amino-7-oxononanoate synthase